MGKTFFISGHLDLTLEEFDQHYTPRILAALAAYGDETRFVVGDAQGADALAQSFLRHRLFDTSVANGVGVSGQVVVYHMFTSPRNNVGGFPTRGGYRSDEERDMAMTLASDEDIAYVRPGRLGNNSGTERNIDRREQLRGHDPEAQRQKDIHALTEILSVRCGIPRNHLYRCPECDNYRCKGWNCFVCGKD